MNDIPRESYEFDGFRFEADRLALYYSGQLVKGVDKKALEVLAVLLRNPNKLVKHDEIIAAVWGDNLYGITSIRVNQYVSKLKKLFEKYNPNENFIENSKGLGYIFVAKIVLSKSEPKNTASHSISTQKVEIAEEPNPNNNSRTRSLTLISILVGLVFLASAVVWLWQPESNEDEIRRIVKESQMYESLILYKNPDEFKEEELDKYWTAELEINTNYDRQRIREAVKKLKEEGRRHGDGTKCEQFDFQSIEISADKTTAIVKTLEKWFLAVYFNDGTLQKNKTVGPYFVSYILKKENGRWLIQKSSTARVIRPIPQLSSIEFVTEPAPRKEFLIKIAGQDFEPEMILLEVIGPGCPEIKPCIVPNSALRERTKLSDKLLDNVPLTISSGDFKITARNGDSATSLPVYIKVP